MLYPVILCGGSGTRLWPMSRTHCPKQFVEYQKDVPSFFEQTYQRVQHLQKNCAGSAGGARAAIVLCHEEYRFYVAASLQKMHEAQYGPAQIILEPEARNTAPAIAMAALAAQEENPDAVMLVLPSDHVLKPENVLVEAVQAAMGAVQEGFLVTFGITPQSPKTGYGYIEKGAIIGNPAQSAAAEPHVYSVQQFVEKPTLERATAMLAQGGFAWNSGMFLFKASAFLSELEKFMPQMLEHCRHAWQQRQQDKDFTRPHAPSFCLCEAESIDYAVMERTQKAAVVPLQVQWSDMGSWESFYEVGADVKDSDDNVLCGDVMTLKTKQSFIQAESRLVVALGLEDAVVVETADAVLVAQKNYAQEVKAIAAQLQAEGRKEALHHNKIARPWGHYESLAQAERFQVKRIVVMPGATLSLQMHHHRAEHWVVVSGTAEVTKDEEVLLLTENQSTYIPQGATHRLKNPGIIPLVLIEIQSGTYLGEDDIVRYDDAYGRVEK